MPQQLGWNNFEPRVARHNRDTTREGNPYHHSCYARNVPYPCNFCGTALASVKRNEKIHTLSLLERSYPCNFCGLRYMNKQSVINHQKQNCPKKGDSQDLQSLAQIASPDIEKVGNGYICTHNSCLFTNTQRSEMIKHFTDKHPEIKAVNLNNIKDASKPVAEKIYANIQNSNDLKKVNSNDKKSAYSQWATARWQLLLILRPF